MPGGRFVGVFEVLAQGKGGGGGECGVVEDDAGFGGNGLFAGGHAPVWMQGVTS